MKSEVVREDSKKWVFRKNDPLREDFEKKSFQKDSPRRRSQNHVLCVNFVKFGPPEIDKIVRYVPDKKNNKKKTKNRPALPLSLLRGLRPKSVRASSRQYTRSAPNFIQIRSLPAEL